MTKQKKQKQAWSDFLFLVRHIKFAWGWIIVAVIAAIVNGVVAGKIPDEAGKLFDGNFTVSRIWPVISLCVISLLIGASSTFSRLFAEAKSTLAARNTAWDYMLNTHASFYDEHDPGNLFSLITEDCQAISAGVLLIICALPTLLAYMASSLLIIIGYNQKLLMVLLVIIPMNLIFDYVVGRWEQKLGRKHSIAVGRLTGYLAERIKHLMMIKSFNAEKTEDANGIEASEKIYRLNREYAVIGVTQSSFNALSMALTSIIAVLWGAALLRSGEVDLASYISFTMYVTAIAGSLSLIEVIWMGYKDYAGRAFRLARLIEAPREEDKKSKASSDIPTGDLKAEGLRFVYPGTEIPVIKSLDFTIPAGRVTAIVGPSGSGKTTLVKLLERLYDPSDGRITINGQDIQNYSKIAWRNRIGYVVQDAAVFSGTLRDALCYGSDEAVSDERLMQVINEVELGDFVNSLPKKLDTVLGSFGTSLSGGQRQRIVIARAILRDADIYIFDEPTSALDPEAAQAVSNLILRKFDGKTVIIISHELNYVTAANHILVIDQGSLEAAGPHRELLEKSDTYREFIEEQSYQEVFEA